MRKLASGQWPIRLLKERKNVRYRRLDHELHHHENMSNVNVKHLLLAALNFIVKSNVRYKPNCMLSQMTS